MRAPLVRTCLLIAAAVLAAAPAPSPALALALAADASAEAFLPEEIRAANGLVELGALAASKGAAPQVRRYGQTLSRDAARQRAQQAELARKLGLEIPAGTDEEDESQLKTLGELEGHDFDQAFARFVLYDQRRDLQRLEAQAKAGAPLVADLARAELPDARRDLARAEALDHAVGNA